LRQANRNPPQGRPFHLKVTGFHRKVGSSDRKLEPLLRIAARLLL
jgi:hypothetical protein